MTNSSDDLSRLENRPDLTDLPDLFPEDDEEYQRGYEAGLRAQFQIDCEAECTACGKPDKYRPAVWVENDNTYQHEVIKTGKMEYCDATLLYMAQSDSHKDK